VRGFPRRAKWPVVALGKRAIEADSGSIVKNCVCADQGGMGCTLDMKGGESGTFLNRVEAL